MSNSAHPGLDAAAASAPLAYEPLTEPDAATIARVFKALADPVRLRLFSLIASHEDGEVCVLDLAEAFHVTQPTVSHHLKVLREAGLIVAERRATSMYYSVKDHALARLCDLLAPPDPSEPA
jgi:ArsR family transcriptional regulator